MTQNHITWIEGAVVENEVHLTIVELSHAARTPEDLIMEWVSEGILSPVGATPHDWRFSGDSLKTARTAAHLAHDLELNTPGIALALNLLEEITHLRSRLERENLG